MDNCIEAKVWEQGQSEESGVIIRSDGKDFTIIGADESELLEVRKRFNPNKPMGSLREVALEILKRKIEKQSSSVAMEMER